MAGVVNDVIKLNTPSLEFYNFNKSTMPYNLMQDQLQLTGNKIVGPPLITKINDTGG